MTKKADELDKTLSGMKRSMSPPGGTPAQRMITVEEALAMQTAFEELASANIELVRVVEKNEEDNERTRTEALALAERAAAERRAISKMLRLSFVLGFLSVCTVAAAFLFQVESTTRDIETKTKDVIDRVDGFENKIEAFEKQLTTIDGKLDRNLGVFSKVADAVSSNLEADVSGSREEATLKAVEAQEAALEAEVANSIESEKKVPEQTKRKLEEVKAKKRSIAPPEMPSIVSD
jgi:hypothetical protein